MVVSVLDRGRFPNLKDSQVSSTFHKNKIAVSDLYLKEMGFLFKGETNCDGKKDYFA